MYLVRALREREREREKTCQHECHRGGTGDTGGGDFTRDPTPTQRGGPRRGPTTGGEGPTGDPHRTHTGTGGSVGH